jgi:DNA-directed RNA polymerase subunit beta'
MTFFEQKFDYLTIKLASPNTIMKWCHYFLPNGKKIGEVLKYKTINYKTLKPEFNGLFCEKIFGPIKSWECACGKHKHKYYNGLYCEYCDVQIVNSIKRRYLMGYINLLYPVVNIWYLKSIPNLLSIILNKTIKELEDIVYFKDLDFLSENSGTFYIKKLLKNLNLNKEIFKSRSNINNFNLIKKYQIRNNNNYFKRIRIFESFITTGSKPIWMLLKILPVLPAGLRPMIELENGKFAASDTNELYKKIIIRNNRLNKLINIYAPQIIQKNEKRMIQEAVDNLIDNQKAQNKALSINDRPLQSLSDVLKGKQGRFRQNLLGKRVDYSGRSVIIVDPTLNLNNCGLPFGIAIELFKPFLIHGMISQGLCENFIAAKKFLANNIDAASELLRRLFINHPIFLNRAPTLHRLGIQAFEPLLVEGNAIKLHPLVCSAFNADFDGDQMAVHLPLSLEAQAEAYLLMLSPYNFLSPATGEPIMVPTQDMVIGCYYLTLNNIKNSRGSYHYFSDFNDAILAYANSKIDLHSVIWVRNNELNDKSLNKIPNQVNKHGMLQCKTNNKNQTTVKYLKTTIGRILFNDVVTDTNFF